VSAVHRAALVAIALLTLAGCGKEVGRIPFTSEGTSRATLELEAGEIAFWTSLDIQYQGSPALEYRIDLCQSGHLVATAVCDPLGPKSVKAMWSEIQNGDTHSQSGSGKMNCSAKLPSAGPTSIEASLVFTTPPTALALTKADLVIRQ